MKQVTIVGVGMGADTLTTEGRRAIEQADALLGAPRLIAQFDNQPSFVGYTPEYVRQVLEKHEHICVLVSGDVGFYSASENLCAALSDCGVTLVPGVSSLSYFFARLKQPWQDAEIISCHGRGANLADTVRRNRLTFVLTGGNAAEIVTTLIAAGYGGLTVYVGENLGSPDERILTLKADEFTNSDIGKMAVLLIENPDYDKRVRFGIPDTKFIRGNVPMTKAETRAVTMSKLALAPDAVCWDIGAGTGSVTVEMSLSAYEGYVYAIDKNEEAIRLVTENCRVFHIGNVTTIADFAPSALESLPPPDAVFIGGGSGKIGEIFDVLFCKNPQVRVIVNAITLETLHAAAQAFTAHGIVPDILQLTVSRAKQTGDFHMLEANSPVFILSGGGNE